MVAEQVVLDNQKLVYSAAGYFSKYQDKEDLVQEGNLGFIKAMSKYDNTKGAKATTYAYGYILGEMRKYAREDKGIKISRDITRLNLMIEKATIMLSQKLMREPSITELSRYLGEAEETISSAIKSVNVLQSIDNPINGCDDNDLTLHDVVADKQGIDLDTLIDLKNSLESLDPIERQIIENRYLKDLTQTEIANLLGMSQVQVSRCETKILLKLKGKLLS